jgi:hypothetical protein
MEALMVELLKRTEQEPLSFLTLDLTLSEGPAALPPAFIWRRLEDWISYRFSPREVEWILAGPGDWTPDLAPATVTSVESWFQGQWQAVTLSDAPLGLELATAGPYRITATVGGGDVPAPVQEAFRRLAEYMAETAPSEIDKSNWLGTWGSWNQQDGKSPNWLAKALHLSGAADLLRSYRRV